MPEIEELFAREPLLAFSIYTTQQVRILRSLGDEIRNHLELGMTPGVVDGPRFIDAYANFWLWVLGAYEVVRTMDQAKHCFSSQASDRTRAYKRRIAKLRIPFAKQEFAGDSARIGGEASVSGIDSVAKDLRFSVRGEVLSVRELLDGFEAVVDGISRNDVLGHIRDR